jgi:hypothetical protein
MSWAKLLADNRVTELPPNKAELDNLRSIVARNLKDVESADPAFRALSADFDGCRMKRNSSEYGFAGGVSDTDAKGLLTAVRQFAIDGEAWIKARHPHLA